LGILLAITIFISAFLLFQVQPLISKFILPWFGGSPAVWTTAMLFFQCTLFLGYVYSHLLFSRLGLAKQVKVHIGLLFLASIMAVFVIPVDALKPQGTEDPTLRILLLLGLSVGLPYAVLSTTGPLIQAWFTRAYPGRSPYRLFSLSNIGSLIALGSFPFVFEPFMELKTMGHFWMIGFWIFAGLCAICGLNMLRISEVRVTTAAAQIDAAQIDGAKVDGAQVDGAQVDGAQVDSDSEPRPTSSVWRRVSWIGLSALSSLMFIATTNHVCHDIATIPFLWIVPLALYLLTFIICFDHPRWYIRELWCGLCLVAILALVGIDWDLGFVPDLVLHFGTMFLICLVCHGELVKLRPENRHHITEYYLLISAGGALGGLFITLIATPYFDRYYEWSLGLLLSFAIAAIVFLGTVVKRKRSLGGTSRWVVGFGVVAGMCFVAWCLDPLEWKNAAEGDGAKNQILLQARNFYGTVTVSDRQYLRAIPAEENNGIARDLSSGHRSFRSGHVLHGRQWTDASKRDLPVTYYGKDSGVGLTLKFCLEQSHKDQPLKFAVVGLGAGSLASYARPAANSGSTASRAADECVIYEINPLVEQIAREQFWYLPDYEQRLGKPLEVRLGDARLTMEREPPQEYDVIVLDAFSGDSVPAHLLTREAFEIYRRHLKKNEDGTIAGIICIHITNTYLNLYPVVKNAAEQVLEMKYTSVYKESDTTNLLQRNHYFMISNDQAFLDQIPMVPRFVSAPSSGSGQGDKTAVDLDWPGISLWTDHYSTIFNILLNE